MGSRACRLEILRSRHRQNFANVSALLDFLWTISMHWLCVCFSVCLLCNTHCNTHTASQSLPPDEISRESQRISRFPMLNKHVLTFEKFCQVLGVEMAMAQVKFSKVSILLDLLFKMTMHWLLRKFLGEGWLQYRRVVADNYSSRDKEVLLEFLFMIKTLSAQGVCVKRVCVRVCAREFLKSFSKTLLAQGVCVCIRVCVRVCVRENFSKVTSMIICGRQVF